MTSKSLCDAAQVLQSHLCSIPVPAIREALNIDDSAVSRIKSGDRRLSFAEFCTIIRLPSEAHPQGLSLSPARAIVITRERFRSLCDLARETLNMMYEEKMV